MTDESDAKTKRLQRPSREGLEALQRKGVGAPKNNRNGLVHGAHIQSLLTEDEWNLFLWFYDEMYAKYDFNYCADAMLITMCAYDFVCWHRALSSAEEELQMKYRREVIILLDALKATPEKREPLQIQVKTPAEWAADLLARVQVDPSAIGAKREKNVG